MSWRKDLRALPSISKQAAQVAALTNYHWWPTV